MRHVLVRRTYLLILLGLLCVLAATGAHAQPTELSGYQSGGLAAGEYLAIDTLRVASDDVWRLYPGVTIRFQPGTALVSGGQLIVNGSEDEPVVLTAQDSTQGWNGIDALRLYNGISIAHADISCADQINITGEDSSIRDSRFSHMSEDGVIMAASISSDSLVIKNCVFEDIDGLAFHADVWDFHLEDCQFARCQSGVNAQAAGEMTVLNCEFEDMNGSALGVTYNSTLTVDSCRFTRCESGVYSDAFDAASIRNCEFVDVNCFLFLYYPIQMLVEDCSFSHSDTVDPYSAHADYGSDLTFRRCTFDGYVLGDDASLIHSLGTVALEQCTFANLSSTFIGYLLGGGLGAGTYTVNSCVFSNCQVFLTGEIESAELTYCDFFDNATYFLPDMDSLGEIVGENDNGDPEDIFHNIFLDPQFDLSSPSGFGLLETSPCIDAGDPALPLDPDGSRADMGAYPYDQGTAVAEAHGPELPEMELTLFPNPGNGQVTIRAEGFPSATRLEVFNLLGRRVMTRPLQPSTTLDTGHLASGTYLVRLRSGERVLANRTLSVIR